MPKTPQILSFFKHVLLTAFNKQAAPEELSPTEKDIAQKATRLRSLTSIEGIGGRNVAFNSAPLTPDHSNEVREISYGLIKAYPCEPSAWRAVLNAQQNLFHRSAAQGLEFAMAIYFNIRTEGKVDPREIEMIQEIAWIAKNAKTDERKKAYDFVASIEYADQALQSAMRSLVHSSANGPALT